jgi:hypothetical protein
LGDPLSSPIVAERRLRPLLALSAEQQKAQVGVMLSGKKSVASLVMWSRWPSH